MKTTYTYNELTGLEQVRAWVAVYSFLDEENKHLIHELEQAGFEGVEFNEGGAIMHFILEEAHPCWNLEEKIEL